MNYYVCKEDEKNIGWHIPFTPYFFWKKKIEKRTIWYIVCKEFTPNLMEDGSQYSYRFL